MCIEQQRRVVAAGVQVGSGFDVCAAAFGSMRYCRVSSEVLSRHMAAVDDALSAAWVGDAVPAAVSRAQAVLLQDSTVSTPDWDFDMVRPQLHRTRRRHSKGCCVLCWRCTRDAAD
jgi:hypothetical protein